MPEAPDEDDWSFLFRTIGCLPTVLGGTIVLAGAAYALTGAIYGGAVLLWSLMWGLMFAGVGCAVMATGRHWLAILGALSCASSALLVYSWDFLNSLDDSWLWCLYPGAALGIAIACFSLLRSFHRAK